MNTMVGQNSTTNVGMQYSLFAGDILQTALNSYSFDANNVYHNAIEEIQTSSGDDYIQNSGQSIHNYSAEKTTNS